jgi:predicted kinase
MKKLTILRGISGSGKSTLAREKFPEAKVFSTDDRFIVEGQYRFNPASLGEAHHENQRLVEYAMQQGEPHIVVDNTNTRMWEMLPYARLAVAYGYQIDIVEPTTTWRFDVDELAKRNTHGVPRESIKNMVARYEHDITPEDLIAVLRSKSVPA